MQKPPYEGIVQYFFFALKWKVTMKIKVQEKNTDKYSTITTPKYSGLP